MNRYNIHLQINNLEQLKHFINNGKKYGGEIFAVSKKTREIENNVYVTKNNFNEYLFFYCFNDEEIVKDLLKLQ